jgi:ribosomal subunit interface protein
MKHPLQVTLRDIGNSEAIEATIREKVAKLEELHDDIISCRVSAEVLGRHKHQGHEFSVKIDIRMPGGEIAINHDHSEDMHVALRDAFAAAKRKMDEFIRQRRGDVKRHNREKRAVVEE